MASPTPWFWQWLPAHLHLVLPLALALVMAGWDFCTRRIPNFLTLGGALAGLVFQAAAHGLSGLAQGFLGLALGLGLLLPFYWKAGLGAGDVKALAALGTWLGPLTTLYL
ncbi:MAG: prepilin peptidase, partial [Deltaproteobacteria bacterium]|nr:prepilin peptidase [Deltaproteobacteria bacterium]